VKIGRISRQAGLVLSAAAVVAVVGLATLPGIASSAGISLTLSDGRQLPPTGPIAAVSSTVALDADKPAGRGVLAAGTIGIAQPAQGAASGNTTHAIIRLRSNAGADAVTAGEMRTNRPLASIQATASAP
jgi:hypothetical protein